MRKKSILYLNLPTLISRFQLPDPQNCDDKHVKQFSISVTYHTFNLQLIISESNVIIKNAMSRRLLHVFGFLLPEVIITAFAYHEIFFAEHGMAFYDIVKLFNRFLYVILAELDYRGKNIISIIGIHRR